MTSLQVVTTSRKSYYQKGLTNELQVLLDVLHSVLRFTSHVAVIAALLGFFGGIG